MLTNGIILAICGCDNLRHVGTWFRPFANIVLSVTNYLDLRNDIIVHCISHFVFIPTKGQNGCSDII